MQNVFRYFLLLGVYVVPIFFIMEDTEKFPILLFGVLGITIAFWLSIIILKRRKPKEWRVKSE